MGGLLGTFSYDWLERRARLASLMRICLLIETFTHLGLALTTSRWVAAAIMFVFGAYAFVWGTLSAAVRMRAVPTRLQGRIGSVYYLAVFGGILVGQAIGGAIAQHLGRHRSLLVRLRGLSPHPGLDLACAGRHRARRSSGHGVVVDSVKVSVFEYVPVRSGSLEPIDCWKSIVTGSLLIGPA